jgi:8-oxo-dGTP pyrophosphatase MutT (NUDIX family)
MSRAVDGLSPNQAPSAGGVVLVGDRVLVVIKRLNGEVRLPKGRIDDGEDPAAAALREVAEETGFADLSIARHLGTRQVAFRLVAGAVTRELTFFLMHPRSFARCQRPPKDAQRFLVRWMGVGEAIGALTYPDEQGWLREAVA